MIAPDPRHPRVLDRPACTPSAIRRAGRSGSICVSGTVTQALLTAFGDASRLSALRGQHHFHENARLHDVGREPRNRADNRTLYGPVAVSAASTRLRACSRESAQAIKCCPPPTDLTVP
jgi:hypothetical protein